MYSCIRISKSAMLFILFLIWPLFAAASIDLTNEQLPQLLPIIDGGSGDVKTADHEFVGYLTPKPFELNSLILLSVFAAHFPPWHISESHSTQKN